MDFLINKALGAVWEQMCAPNQEFRTPDVQRGSPFSLAGSDDNSVTILTNEGNQLTINREAFFEALRYLNLHQHGPNNRCEIRSRQERDLAGPLCQATRDVNNDTRVITYIAPMLTATGLVGLDGNRPNRIWLA